MILGISVLVVLIVSAMASGTEAALFAVSVGQVKAFIDEKRRGAVALKALKDDMSNTITTVVIINNIANIVGSMFIGTVADKQFGGASLGPISYVGLFSAMLTFLVIAFAEIVPKTLGERYAERISLTVATPLRLLTSVFTPLIWVLDVVTRPVTRFSGQGLQVTSEAEIKALTELGKQAGILEEGESDLIQQAFALTDIDAGDLMTPLAKVDYLQAESQIGELKKCLANLTHTRLPVIDGTFDKLEGVVHIRNLLQALAEDKDEMLVREFAHDPTFIPSTAAGAQLLDHFRKTKQHLTIVVDGFGTMLGVLTLEDVLEVLVGDIVDETDLEDPEIEIISEDTVLVLAEADAIDVNEVIFVHLPDMRVGELIVEELGRIPEQGEVFMIGVDAEFTVISGSPRAINKVQIRKMESEVDEDSEATKFPSMETANPSP